MVLSRKGDEGAAWGETLLGFGAVRHERAGRCGDDP